MGKGLTAKQARFAEEYLIDGNATAAAKRAGYSEKTAQVIGSENLRKPLVAAAIAERQAVLREKTQISQEMVVQELAAMAFANMLDYIGIGEDGLPYVDFFNLTRKQASAITQLTSEIHFQEHGDNTIGVKRSRFRLADKRGPLNDLYKLLGFEPPKKIEVEVGGTVNYTIEELRAQARRIAEGLIEAEVVE